MVDGSPPSRRTISSTLTGRVTGSTTVQHSAVSSPVRRSNSSYRWTASLGIRRTLPIDGIYRWSVRCPGGRTGTHVSHPHRAGGRTPARVWRDARGRAALPGPGPAAGRHPLRRARPADRGRPGRGGPRGGGRRAAAAVLPADRAGRRRAGRGDRPDAQAGDHRGRAPARKARDMTGLERWYRRRLLAYPRRYRRTRGLELLTTLLDASGPDQRRPHWRDAVDVVATGLRYRFALPGGRWVATAVVFVALAAAALGAAGGARLGWQDAPDLPADDVLTTCVQRLTPSQQSYEPTPDEIRPLRIGGRLPWIPVQLLGGADSGDSAGVMIVPSRTSLANTLDLTRDRLHPDGWRTDPARTLRANPGVNAPPGRP